MSEQPSTSAAQSVPQPEKKGKAPATHEQKQKRRRLIRRIIVLALVAAIVAAGVYLLRKFVFKSDENGLGEVMTMPVMRSSIQSTVSGMGNARAKNSASVTPEAGSRVLELFVAEGDYVEKGQLLYNLDDSAAQEAILAAQENIRTARENAANALKPVAEYNDEIARLQADMANLTITAPHDGKLLDVSLDLKPGMDANLGDPVATVVNDTKMRLSLYYSWAYDGQITVGQKATISIPASMTDITGTVEQVNYVRRVVPEGSVMFEVVFLMDNPGTLTEGMAATATLTAADGTPIYPYSSGSLRYYETTRVVVKIGGPVLSVNLMNYADVKKGQVLVRLGDTSISKQIDERRAAIRETQKSAESAQKMVDTAIEALAEAEKKLENYHAVAPISGRILSCGLIQGNEVGSGDSIYIADTATMMVDINIDERNIGYVSKGMFVDMRDQMGNYYMGIMDQVSLTAKAENGVATFPAVVVVDNPEGKLMTGSYMDYTFIASQSNDCLVVPIQAVKNVTLAEGQDVYGPSDFDPNDYSFEYEGGKTDPDTPDAPADGGDFLPGDGLLTEPGLPVEGGDVDFSFEQIDALPGEEVIVDNTIPGAIAIAEPWFGGSVMGPDAFRNKGTATVCFVQGEPDERAIEAQEGWEVPEGFFAVLVETGLSDDTNVEIKSGLREGDIVFTGYMTDSANNWGMYG